MRLMLVVAHPDDEAFGCGSALAHASAHGVDCTVVCATRGELGEPAPGCGVERADLPAVREQELRAATAHLGVARVELLGWIDSGTDGDPAPGSLVAADVGEVAARIGALLEELRPDVVMTLDASDGHRDHAAVRDATVRAVAASERKPTVYLYCLVRSLFTEFVGGATTLGTPDEQITARVDVSRYVDQRWAAMRLHRSQVPPFDAMPDDLQRRWLSTDFLKQVAPPWPGGPPLEDWIPRRPGPSGE